ncbi:MAG: hypothetical protein M3O61_20500 [Gemmatimonadota bacterium]|nr:hypothetical protein [Gemmatimonadota bacterium]
MYAMLRTMRLLMAVLVASLASASYVSATCYTCTQSPPHVCVPTTGQGWEVCFSGGRNPCLVDDLTECYGSEGISDMLATRSLLLRVSEKVQHDLFAGMSTRTFKGQGRVLSAASVGTALGLSGGVEFMDSGFSLGDAEGDRPVSAWFGYGMRVLARGSFQGAVMTLAYEADGAAQEIQARSGDLVLVSVRVNGQPAILALATDRITPDEPGLIEHLTALQTRFQGEVAGWDAEAFPALFATR